MTTERPANPLRRAVGLGSPPWILGHRGSPAEETENTVASVQRAVTVGVDAVELDVQLTADGELAVLHDWSLERLAASTLVAEQATWHDLAGLRVHDPRVESPPRPIPRLADVLTAVPRRLPLNVELKRRRADRDRFAGTLLAALSGRERVWVSSFDWELLALLRRRDPEIPLAPLASRRRRGFEAVAEELGAVALHCATRVVSRALLERAQAAGRPLLVYTVNDPALARDLVARGVAGLFTDDPATLVAALR
ncbi:MAG: glycerophosphodiester phosphodiesterase [Thermoanaerobaculia bacterium]